jgi:hypothetical protein
MLVGGQQRRIGPTCDRSADMQADMRRLPLRAKAAVSNRSKAALFDHLVGAGD